jgi:hypothetical protein
VELQARVVAEVLLQVAAGEERGEVAGAGERSREERCEASERWRDEIWRAF